MVSDQFARVWHNYGITANATPFYKRVNKLTTRKCDGLLIIIFLISIDQHFLRSINTNCSQVEIIYPSSLKLYLAKEQLNKFIDCNKIVTKNKVQLQFHYDKKHLHGHSHSRSFTFYQK